MRTRRIITRSQDGERITEIPRPQQTGSDLVRLLAGDIIPSAPQLAQPIAAGYIPPSGPSWNALVVKTPSDLFEVYFRAHHTAGKEGFSGVRAYAGQDGSIVVPREGFILDHDEHAYRPGEMIGVLPVEQSEDAYRALVEFEYERHPAIDHLRRIHSGKTL